MLPFGVYPEVMRIYNALEMLPNSFASERTVREISTFQERSSVRTQLGQVEQPNNERVCHPPLFRPSRTRGIQLLEGLRISSHLCHCHIIFRLNVGEVNNAQRWSRYPRQYRAGLKWWAALVHIAFLTVGSVLQ